MSPSWFHLCSWFCHSNVTPHWQSEKETRINNLWVIRRIINNFWILNSFKNNKWFLTDWIQCITFNVNTIFQLYHWYEKIILWLAFFRYILYLRLVDLMHVEEDLFCSTRYLNTSLKMAVIYVFFLFLDLLQQVEDYVRGCHAHH